MNTNKNTYTVIYAIVLVVVVAALLAIVSLSLKERQNTNVEVEKQMQILGSAHLAKDAKSAPNRIKYVQDEFAKYITKAFIVDANGNIVKEFTSDIVKSEAFTVSPKDQYEIMKKIDEGDESAKAQLKLPVYICTTPDANLVILSCYGQGLWGPIWGYMSLSEDLTTVKGILFDHESETPGLGAEIASEKFQSQFDGKTIVKNGEVSPVKVVKGGAKDPECEVDAISGATVTSSKVQLMIAQWLKYYEPFINAKE